MKAKRILDIIIACMLILFAGIYFYNHYYNPPLPKKAVVKIIKANDLLKYKTKISTKVLNTTLTSSACTLFLKNSVEKSFNEYSNEFIEHHMDESLKTCSGALPAILQSAFDECTQLCKDSTREHITNHCYTALIKAKVSSAGAIIKPDTDLKGLDATLLMHLMAYKIISGQFAQQAELTQEIVDTLLEKEPSYFGGYKVKLMLLSMTSLNEDDQNKEVFNETLQQARRLNSNDPDLLELELAERTEVFKSSDQEIDDKSAEHKKSFIDYLKRESAKHPKAWIYDYYQAQVLYNKGQGDYEQTVALIDKSLKKFPNENRLKETLANLKSDDENKRKNPFLINIAFKLDDL